MILADKIVALRKKKGWSQEELAEKLGISRQSVSKWESSASIPDIDKIIMISELFGVTTDYLLKDKIEETTLSEHETAEETAVRNVSLEEAGAFMNLTRKYAFPKAVALFVLCPTPLILLAGLAEYGRLSMTDEMAGGLGMAFLLVMVAIGVAVLKLCGTQLSKYDYLDKEDFILRYGVQGIVEKNKEMFSGAYHISITIGVVFCILGALPVFLAAAMGSEELTVIYGVNLLLVMIAVAVFLFVWAGTIQSSFHKLLQTEEYSSEQKALSKRTKYFAGAYWCAMTAFFLIIICYCEFISHDFEYRKILGIFWPVAALLFAAIKKVMYAMFVKH